MKSRIVGWLVGLAAFSSALALVLHAASASPVHAVGDRGSESIAAQTILPEAPASPSARQIVATNVKFAE